MKEVELPKAWKDRADAARSKAYDSYKPQQKPKGCIEDYFDTAPEGDFKWDTDGGDWHVWNCEGKDCETQWHKACYALNIGRRNGKRYLEYVECDTDGNWYNQGYWEDGYGKEELNELLCELEGESRHYFAGWTRYYVDCFYTGKDVLNEGMKPHTREQWLEAAEDMAKYLDKK